MREGNIFSLFTPGKGGTPSLLHNTSTGPMYFLRGWVLHLHPIILPLVPSGGVPQPWQDRKPPSRRGWYLPSRTGQDGGTPVQERIWSPPLPPGQIMLGQVKTWVVHLLPFPTGGLSCFQIFRLWISFKKIQLVRFSAVIKFSHYRTDLRWNSLPL